MSSPLLSSTDLRREFRRGQEVIRAVSGVTLQVAAGDYMRIHGSSGAGKSTLLYVLGGMLRPSSGSVQIEGQDLYALSAGHRRAIRNRTIGFAFQGMHLLPYLSAVANVALGCVGRTKGESLRQAHDSLEALGLESRSGHRPGELSAGERQRVALARALVAAPALLLADEPTGNLDDESAQLVCGQLEGFRKQGGAVVLATHDARLDQGPTRRYELRAGCLYPD